MRRASGLQTARPKALMVSSRTSSSPEVGDDPPMMPNVTRHDFPSGFTQMFD